MTDRQQPETAPAEPRDIERDWRQLDDRFIEAQERLEQTPGGQRFIERVRRAGL